MVSPKENLYVLRPVNNDHYFSTDSRGVFRVAQCTHCESTVMAAVASLAPDGEDTEWLRCAGCNRPAIVDRGRLIPAAKPLKVPKGLPEEMEPLWDEARTCLQNGANTGAVMLCRKLLFHVAVDKGLPDKKANGWAPNFYECVQHLEDEGYFTPNMRRWVDRVKDVGNEQNHELKPIEPAVALDVATFAQQLLVLAYEMDSMLETAEPG